MIGHHARFRENDDLPLWRGPAAKKKPPFFNAPALITRKIMHSRDAQCNTGEGRSRPLLLRFATAHANSHATSCIERAR